MPAQYVKAYVKRNKNDAADAEAICEAVMRPTMRFVSAKTAEQQAAVLLHRGRERLVRQRTMLVNARAAHAPQRKKYWSASRPITRDSFAPLQSRGSCFSGARVWAASGRNLSSQRVVRV